MSGMLKVLLTGLLTSVSAIAGTINSLSFEAWDGDGGPCPGSVQTESTQAITTDDIFCSTGGKTVRYQGSVTVDRMYLVVYVWPEVDPPDYYWEEFGPAYITASTVSEGYFTGSSGSGIAIFHLSLHSSTSTAIFSVDGASVGASGGLPYFELEIPFVFGELLSVVNSFEQPNILAQGFAQGTSAVEWIEILDLNRDPIAGASFYIAPEAAIPEPATFILVMVPLGCIVLLRWRGTTQHSLHVAQVDTEALESS